MTPPAGPRALGWVHCVPGWRAPSGRSAWAVLALLGALTAMLGACGGAQVRGGPEAGGTRRIPLQGRVALELELPAGYEMQSESGATFDVFHVWRVPPLPEDKDTSMGIFVGRPVTAYCRPRSGSYEPAAFKSWQTRWHTCGVTEGPGQQIWEAHIRGATAESIHIFILGPDGAEVRRLKAIAETLVPAP